MGSLRPPAIIAGDYYPPNHIFHLACNQVRVEGRKFEGEASFGGRGERIIDPAAWAPSARHPCGLQTLVLFSPGHYNEVIEQEELNNGRGNR